MDSSLVVIQGFLRPDGVLELDNKPNIPPGRVEITLRSLKESSEGEPGWWTVLQNIWKENQSTGFKGRTREQVDADVQALRNELEDHARMWNGCRRNHNEGDFSKVDWVGEHWRVDCDLFLTNDFRLSGFPGIKVELS